MGERSEGVVAYVAVGSNVAPLWELAPGLVLPGSGLALACLRAGGAVAGMTADADRTRAARETWQR